MNEFIPYNRYRQQMILPGFGEAAQLKLKKARIFVAGAGGLGCAALQYLAAAGAGTLGIADDDVVQPGNLHRQILYTMQDVGGLKADAAAAWLKRLNPETTIHVYPVRLNSGNISDIIADYDFILDGTDNRETKYLINDACVSAGKPLIMAAISQFEGQLAIFNYPPGSQNAVNYRDVFPDAQPEDLSCEATGVLGVLPGIMGCMQCNEAIKLITGTGRPLINRLLVFNALTSQVNEFSISPAVKKEESKPVFKPLPESLEIKPDEFTELINHNNIMVIDVRESDHRMSPAEFQHVQIPLSVLHENLQVVTGDVIITFCERGILSLHAARMLKAAFGPERKIYSLQKGITHWILNRNKEYE